jgi:hypothetical protein
VPLRRKSAQAASSEDSSGKMKSTKWLKSKPLRSLYIDKEKEGGPGFYVNIETEK